MAKAIKSARKHEQVKPVDFIPLVDDVYDIRSVVTVSNNEAGAALVSAGLGDAYLVKDEHGNVITVFRQTDELVTLVTQLRANTLSVNINDYWDCMSEVASAYSDRWPHEATDRQ